MLPRDSDRTKHTHTMNRRTFIQTVASATLATPSLIAGEASDPVAAGSPPPSAPEAPSKQFSLKVEGRDVPVYLARVAPGDAERRARAMDDKANSHLYFDEASFASFEVATSVRAEITCPTAVKSVKVLPTSYAVRPTVRGRTIALSIDRPMQLTVEVNGQWVQSLHLFADPPEVNPPKPDDPGVIYFGPGEHEVEAIKATSGQTVYLAPGAIVRGLPPKARRGPPIVSLEGERITLRGRGIIDGGLCPTHSRNLVSVQGSDITIEGVVLRDSPVWTVPIRRSDRVTVRNVKVLGYRANSDGIDICNSRDVEVADCFLRTLDDLVVIKTDEGQGKSERITTRRCVLWNQVAHALSVGAELREDVADVLFSDCDVIHDTGREWTLRVFHCDAAMISNIRFEKIRIEESKRAASVWIGKAKWSRDAERGHIRDVLFQDIAIGPANPQIELRGFDAAYRVENTTFRRVTVGGHPLTRSMVKANEFVAGTKIEP